MRQGRGPSLSLSYPGGRYRVAVMSMPSSLPYLDRQVPGCGHDQVGTQQAILCRTARILWLVFMTRLYRLPHYPCVVMPSEVRRLDMIAKARALHCTDNRATACLLVGTCVDTVTGYSLPAMGE